MAFVNEQVDERNWHTIDHERNIVLKLVAANPHIGNEFELNINGETVKFRASSDGSRVHGPVVLGVVSPYDMDWMVYQFSEPVNRTINSTVICQLIEEALRAWGFNYKTEMAYSVSIKYSDFAKGQLA